MNFCPNPKCGCPNSGILNADICSQCGTKIATPSKPEPSEPTCRPENINILSRDDRTEMILSYEQKVTTGISIQMQYIPGAHYWMGSSGGDRYESNETPQHLVKVQPFYLGAHPISQIQFISLMNKNPSAHRQKNLPVEQVNYFDAVQYCELLSEKANREYRLPTEAEWEYACRAGATSNYHTGSTINSDACCFDRHQKEIEGFPTIDSSIAPNAYGLFDMHGNVWEWINDCWHENYRGAPRDGSAWISENLLDSRVIRGGSWRDSAVLCRSGSRRNRDPRMGYRDVGFRIVCN
jgi:eukaryotic-like serine/threonine-protein kinase